MVLDGEGVNIKISDGDTFYVGLILEVLWRMG